MNFKNVAIKCDNWEQMQILAKEAERQGAKPYRYSRDDFKDGQNIFFNNGSKYYNTRAIYIDVAYAIIPFSDFYTPDRRDPIAGQNISSGVPEQKIRGFNAPYWGRDYSDSELRDALTGYMD